MTIVGAKDRIEMFVDTQSDAYQDYLESLRIRERLREESGGDTPEGLEAVRSAVNGVSKEALDNYKKTKAN